jgi:hypothetical protein
MLEVDLEVVPVPSEVPPVREDSDPAWQLVSRRSEGSIKASNVDADANFVSRKGWQTGRNNWRKEAGEFCSAYEICNSFNSAGET